MAPRRRRLSCEQAGRARLRRRDDVPAEVSELLVNALKSHGCVVDMWLGRETVLVGRLLAARVSVWC
jgi:hypothetical protein